jgi:hypothetical protein
VALVGSTPHLIPPPATLGTSTHPSLGRGAMWVGGKGGLELAGQSLHLCRRVRDAWCDSSGVLLGAECLAASASKEARMNNVFRDSTYGRALASGR